LSSLAGRLATTGVVLALTSCAARGLPPLWERESGLPGDLSEDRAVFGLASKTRGPDGALLSAIRPFTAKVESPTGDWKFHVIPPIASHFENDYRKSTKIFPLVFDDVSGDAEDRREDRTDHDTWIFPLLAWGDEPDEGSYFAAFPFGGTLKGKLLTDRIDFVLFPLYTHTKSDDWTSTHLLFPLIAWGSSPTRSHFRVMPFWSQSDSETQHNRTLLWPIGHWSTQKRGERTFDSWFVFPLLGHSSSRDEQFSSWTALFPFFQFSHDERTGDRYVAAPWPFFKRSVRPGVSESTWFWPFYGHYDSETEHSAFYAWPIVWKSDVIDGKRVHRHRYVVPIWMRRSSGPAAGGPPDDEELRSWPLFSWRRRPDGHQDIRIPEIIPFFGWEAGETCYADIVTVFRYRSDVHGREAWDGPLGAVRWRRDVTGAKTLTLLWWIDIPMGDGR
jgi:hypothetical protein